MSAPQRPRSRRDDAHPHAAMTKAIVIAGSDTPCLTLHDGRVVEVRPLEPRDRAGVAAAVSRLSDETRYLRFATPKRELTERELDFLLDVDHHSREAILAVDPSTGYGVAVVRYVEVSGEPRAVEIAATVADDWQGRGLGRALLEQLTSRARRATRLCAPAFWRRTDGRSTCCAGPASHHTGVVASSVSTSSPSARRAPRRGGLRLPDVG